MSNKVNANFGGSLMALILVVVLVLVVNALANSMHRAGPVDMSEAAVAERIAPVASLNTGDPIVPEAAPAPAAAAPTASRSGEDIYRTSCAACHDTGAAGAPMLGDAGAWASFTEKGMDGMLRNSISGVNAMPPRGTCVNCSDDELREAIQFMLDAL